MFGGRSGRISREAVKAFRCEPVERLHNERARSGERRQSKTQKKSTRRLHAFIPIVVIAATINLAWDQSSSSSLTPCPVPPSPQSPSKRPRLSNVGSIGISLRSVVPWMWCFWLGWDNVFCSFSFRSGCINE